MSFSITLFGPRHQWWGSWKNRTDFGARRPVPRVWFYRPAKYSTGGVGFCIPGLHVVFTWGKDKRVTTGV